MSISKLLIAADEDSPIQCLLLKFFKIICSQCQYLLGGTFFMLWFTITGKTEKGPSEN